MNNDTICAIATPAGTGGVGIIRISGDKGTKISSALFTSVKGVKAEDFKPSKMYFGTLKANGFSDSCLCVKFNAPNSFTGEDVIEFQCHGGTALLNGILKAVIDNGARLAECGEFTKRAFVNGKLDLSECEGLIDIINAESEAAVIAASKLLGGTLSKKIVALQDNLKQILSHTEVSIDYSDEDIQPQDRQDIINVLKETEKQLNSLAKTYGAGSLVKQGVTVALCGSPNVGKSSLFNALLGYDRAIVTEIAGTTRDAIEGRYTYNGVLFNIVDTAGIRQSKEIIESKGIELSKQYIINSDAAVFLAESSDFTQEEKKILELLKNKKHILVLSKSDKEGKKNQNGFDLKISALTGSNIDRLKQLLYDITVGKVNTGGLMLTNYRHYDAVMRAKNIIKETIEGAGDMFVDMLAYNIRNAWETLGEITGENSIESVIDNIFSRFCLGK